MMNLEEIDHDIIFKWIEPKSSVIDLGCGDGVLLERLQRDKQVVARGVEISEDGITACIEKGLSVYHANIDEGLSDYPNQSFDYVILSKVVQQLQNPTLVISESLRVGKKVIVSFPNFANFPIRMKLMFYGRMPNSPALPYKWHDSPNIHLITIKDFRLYCKSNAIKILQDKPITLSWWKKDKPLTPIIPNLFAQYGIFKIER